MKRVLAVALGMATAAFAGMPAEYTRLEIEYRADRGGHVVETRKGEIRFGEGSAPAVLRGFLAPKLNAAGRATVRYVEVTRANGRKDLMLRRAAGGVGQRSVLERSKMCVRATVIRSFCSRTRCGRGGAAARGMVVSGSG